MEYIVRIPQPITPKRLAHRFGDVIMTDPKWGARQRHVVSVGRGPSRMARAPGRGRPTSRATSIVTTARRQITATPTAAGRATEKAIGLTTTIVRYLATLATGPARGGRL